MMNQTMVLSAFKKEKHLVVGLGNPGPRYADTRHNAGFWVVDRIRETFKVSDNEKTSLYEHFWFEHDGLQMHLLKPMTFMNDSGIAVREVARDLGFSSSQILVINDCMDLSPGCIRLRRGGGSGGQKGVESIISELGTSSFPRLRVGIGRPNCETIDYVLSPCDSTEKPLLAEAVDVSVEAALCVARRGIDAAMNEYNGWMPKEVAVKPEKEIEP